MPPVTLLHLLTISFATPAKAEDACRYERDGRVSCSADGFKTLTDLVIQHRGRADKCELRLATALKDVVDEGHLRQECQVALDAVQPCPPPASPVWPMLGLGAGVLGTFLMSGALLADVPVSARFPMGLAGLALVGGGIVLAWP